MKRKVSFYVLMLAALISTGCAALVVGAGAGAAGALWYNGKLKDTISAPVPKVYEAMTAGMKDLKIEITGSKADSLEGHVYGRLANGDKVLIDLRSLNSSTTGATIRVGVFGNKELSQRILAAARKHL